MGQPHTEKCAGGVFLLCLLYGNNNDISHLLDKDKKHKCIRVRGTGKAGGQ